MSGTSLDVIDSSSVGSGSALRSSRRSCTRGPRETERLGVVTFVTEGLAKSRDTETFRLVLYADPKCVLWMFQQEISAALLGVRIICIMH